MADRLSDSAPVKRNNPLMGKNGMECARLMQTLEQALRKLVENMSTIGRIG
jgi:hypothetical protein